MYLSTGARLELSPQPLTAAEPKFREDRCRAESSGTVSSVTCHVTWRVIEMQWTVGFFN